MATKQKAKAKRVLTTESGATPKVKVIGKKQTKSEILKAIASETGLTTKVVKGVFVTTANLIKSHLAKRGSGEFMFPEVGIKIMRTSKPATQKREGRHPITGEPITISAKPKRDAIRIKPLKRLKEVVKSP